MRGIRALKKRTPKQGATDAAPHGCEPPHCPAPFRRQGRGGRSRPCKIIPGRLPGPVRPSGRLWDQTRPLRGRTSCAAHSAALFNRPGSTARPGKIQNQNRTARSAPAEARQPPRKKPTRSRKRGSRAGSFAFTLVYHQRPDLYTFFSFPVRQRQPRGKNEAKSPRGRAIVLAHGEKS